MIFLTLTLLAAVCENWRRAFRYSASARENASRASLSSRRRMIWPLRTTCVLTTGTSRQSIQMTGTSPGLP